MRHMEMLGWEKHSTATLGIKQLNDQQYSIMKKHFLQYHKLEEFSQLAQLHDIVYEKFDVVNDSPAKTTNVLVDKPPLCAKKLPTDIQTL